MTIPQADIGVFGGSGFYSFLDDVRQLQIHTPYGAPSTSISLGSIEDRTVAFLPRHGADHQVPAHKVNYRANLWAMRELGIRRLIAPCAVGSLKPEIEPGSMVILDQFVDRTSGRADTFCDGGLPGHVSMADPYCSDVGAILNKTATELGVTVHDRGTVVVVQGPRFSTRAESAWFRSAGWDTINMTQYPEVALARELGMCYSGLALVTDYDTGIESYKDGSAVQMGDVFAMLASNVDRTRSVLAAAIPQIDVDRDCDCQASTRGGPFDSE